MEICFPDCSEEVCADENGQNTNTPPWVDKEVRNLISRKYKALKKYRMNKTITRKSKLRALTQRNKVLNQMQYLIRPF
jgi:hypothetical protein